MFARVSHTPRAAVPQLSGNLVGGSLIETS
jgi:hypothetical protein